MFNQSHTGFPAFCLSVNGTETKLEPVDIEALSVPPSPKLATLLVEFFFETAIGELLPFGDVELLELVIPSVKDPIFLVEGKYFPDRWLSKVYGFDGPVYMVKNGPLEMSISPDGAYCVYTTVDLDRGLPTMLPILEGFVQRFQQSMLALYPKRMGKNAVVRTTYITNKDWQPAFGKLLDGQTFEEAAHRSQQFYTLRHELQSAGPAKCHQQLWFCGQLSHSAGNDQ